MHHFRKHRVLGLQKLREILYRMKKVQLRAKRLLCGADYSPWSYSPGCVRQQRMHNGWNESVLTAACRKLFSDAAATVEISAPEKIPAAHKLEAVEAKAATCTRDGSSKAYWKCSVLRETLSQTRGRNTDPGRRTIVPAAHQYKNAGCARFAGKDWKNTGFKLSKVMAVQPIMEMIIPLR